MDGDVGPEHEIALDLIPWETRAAVDLNATTTGPPQFEFWMRTPRLIPNWRPRSRPTPQTSPSSAPRCGRSTASGSEATARHSRRPSPPGFITEAVPLVMTSIQRQLHGLTIDGYANLSQRNSPELLFDLMGFGRPAGPFEQFRADYLGSSFGPSLRLVAEAIGLPLDSVETSGELAMAARETAIAAGTVAAGCVAAQRITIAGMRGGVPLLQFRATWYCTTDLEPAWEVRDTGWHVSVDGDAPLEVTLRMPIPLDRMAAVSPAYTANRAVNAVPYVCAAARGIHSTLDLPQVVTSLA